MDYQKSNRQIEGYEALVGLLLAYLNTCQDLDAESLLELVQAQQEPLFKEDPDDPCLDPFERLEAILRARLDCPVDSDNLPKEQWKGFPHPSLAVLHRWNQKQPQKNLNNPENLP